MHPAIELLIARMQSNPEEFIRGEWEMEEGNCMAHANEEELAALKATRRTITLDGIHKLIMKHLLNPEQTDLFSHTEQILTDYIAEEEGSSLSKPYRDILKRSINRTKKILGQP